MILALIALGAMLIALRSLYLIIWRFDRSRRAFAWRHFLAFAGTGLISFGIMAVIAIGSMGHYVPSDFDQLMENFMIWFSSIGLITSFLGGFIATIKGIIHLRKVAA